MKVTGEVSRSGNSPGQNLGGISGAKKIFSAGEGGPDVGERFKASIINITPDKMTLKLAGGGFLEARMLTNPDARIGDTAVFLVKDVSLGQILLEMVKPGAGEDAAKGSVSNGVIRDALVSADMPLTDKNVRLVMELVENAMPIDPQTLQKAAFFMYSDERLTFGQIKFLLNEGFAPEEKTVTVFRNVLDGIVGLDKNVNEMIKAAMDLKNGGLRREALGLLGANIDELAVKANVVIENADDFIIESDGGTINIVRKKDIARAVKEKLYADAQNGGFKGIGKVYKELDRVAAEIRSLAGDAGDKAGAEEGKALARAASDVRDNLRFMNQIHNHKEYMQIPFYVGKDENEAELHVYKKRKSRVGRTEEQSALVAMDYPFLKHVEVLITRSKKQVTLQFRAESTRVLNAMGAGLYKLNGALAEQGFTVSGVSFKKLKEASDVTSEPEGAGRGDITKYSVDVRV